LVECQLPKLDVAGSSPVARSATSGFARLRNGLCSSEWGPFLGVTGSHSTDDRLVFDKRGVQIGHHEVCMEPLVSVEPRLQEVDHPAKRRSGARIVQRGMERVMAPEHDVVIELATESGAPKRGMSRSQLSGTGLSCCERESVNSSRGGTFQRACGLIDILSVGDSHRSSSDPRPRATAIDHKQPFR
jgi:hypothetical protein